MARFEVTATDLHDQLSACLNGVAYRGDRLHVVRHGRVVAVVISPDEALRLDAAADAAALQPDPPT
jgi:antitoxin (DNA-binding transcriptional repressor) of toxin-antitoxin stability system